MAYRDDTNDSLKGKTGSAANKALGSHDEPATTGDRVGEGVGGISGAATGAALGSLGGPIGTVIGGIAGAVGGWWSGRAISEAASTFTDDDDQYYRNEFESKRSGSLTGKSPNASGSDYDSARPAYQLGYLAGMNPDYQGRKFDEVETDLQRGWSANAGAGDWTNVRDYARNAYDRGQERRITLSEEQLAIGKRQVQSGEVELRKVVDTEHVRQSVDVTREEVTIERRPLSADAATDVQIGEDEIRIPLMEEEVVVEKRVVPTEEVILRKQSVTENQTVEADLRKERVEYDENDLSRSAGSSASGLTSGSTGTSSGKGLGDKISDAVDNVKDRIDGNPASKPGRDATDSRDRF